LVGYGG